MKRPSFQFYPADWRKDSALQSCSIAARGLWMEMLCIVHECEPYGQLAINGKAMSIAQLARLIGETEKVVKSLLNELESTGVFSRTQTDCIYSRRMIRDEKIRVIRGNAGKLGGNPNLLKQKDNQNPTKAEASSQATDNQTTKQSTKQSLTPSSSSSSSTSVNTEPNGSDANASPPAKPPGEMTKQEFWSVGKSLLEQAGVPKVQCGTFIGKLVKEHGECVVMDAVSATVVKQPADPASFLTATCQSLSGDRPRNPKPSRHNGFDKIDYHEGIAADGSF